MFVCSIKTKKTSNLKKTDDAMFTLDFASSVTKPQVSEYVRLGIIRVKTEVKGSYHSLFEDFLKTISAS